MFRIFRIANSHLHSHKSYHFEAMQRDILINIIRYYKRKNNFIIIVVIIAVVIERFS